MTISFIDQHILQFITKYYLQQDLDTLISCTEAWQMQFNVNKSSILQLPKQHHKFISVFYVRQAPQDY